MKHKLFFLLAIIPLLGARTQPQAPSLRTQPQAPSLAQLQPQPQPQPQAQTQAPQPQPQTVRFDPIQIKDSALVISAYPDGDRIPDYSFCGYMAGEEPLPDLLTDPDVPVIRLTAPQGDATALIQEAIDFASIQPKTASGFRAVVLLSKGCYQLEGSLVISSDGVVLRGAGEGTVLLGCGTTRETLIRIEGSGRQILGPELPLACDYLPVNSVRIPLAEGHGLKPGDEVLITRPSTQEWIEALGTDRLGLYADYNLPAWKPGDFDLHFHRRVLSADEGSIEVDVPLPQSFDSRWGGGYVQACVRPGLVSRVAVENLTLSSEYERGRECDEDHRWMAITIDNARDCWVRRVTARHFVSSAVAIWEGGSRISVEECRCLEPVGEIGGYRRLAFQTFGEQTFFNRCYSEQGYHDFCVGALAAGPNAFVQCYAAASHGFSGALGGWSCGTLFDRVTVENAPIKFTNLELDLQGGGWSSANSLCWMCRAPQIHVADPPGAHNWAYGSRGQAYGGGSHAQHKINRPQSFYLSQLALRKGEAPRDELDKFIYYNPNFSKTDAAFASYHSRRSLEPAWTMDRWIDTLCARYPLVGDAPATLQLPVGKAVSKKAQGKAALSRAPEPLHAISILNGRILRDGALLVGRSGRTALWRGSLRKSDVSSAGIHLTRFVPGRSGRGYTDCMDSIAVQLEGYASFSHFPALWYERRRDDHGRMMRADADVWAPFYDQPFARSGQGEANDRLSRYDLDRWNKWYWSRLGSFSELAGRIGVAFIHEHYLQHNIIEEGAHWVDYPWRDANNINNLGFAEPTYMQGDKRVFMAEEFYNLDNERLVSYHKKYVRKSLEAVENGPNVIHHIGLEYTGPADFMKFWIRTIIEWEKETGRDVKLALNATKDVTDEILSDPELCAAVDVIDIRHWYYRTDGGLYAPPGGVSLAPRQYPRVMDAGSTDSGCVWKAVREYRQRYPDKAVLYNSGRVDGASWIAALAGASLCQLPQNPEAEGFYQRLALMEPISGSESCWVAGKAGTGYAAYTRNGRVDLDLSADKGSYRLLWLDPASGKALGKAVRLHGGKPLSLEAPAAECVAYLY